MTVREPKKRSNLRLKLGGAYFSAQRKLRWLSMRKHFARERSGEDLAYQAFSHNPPLMRKLKDVDMQLQRNKVNKVVGQAALIQSVGSLALLAEIEKTAAARELTQELLLEVNIGREAAKSGFLPEEVFAAAEAALEHPHVRVLGLMTIPPADADRDANMRYFEQVRTLYVDINAKLFHNELKHLSMGMSGDYADAIAAGATMVRVGTAIFGARHYL